MREVDGLAPSVEADEAAAALPETAVGAGDSVFPPPAALFVGACAALRGGGDGERFGPAGGEGGKAALAASPIRGRNGRESLSSLIREYGT
jgi:hypothetical protein